MSVTVIPGEEFKRQFKRLAKKYKSLVGDMREMQKEIIADPLLGTDLGGNTHKVRMAIASKGKGKSGGARIITYVVTKEGDTTTVRLLTIYDKSEIANVSDKYIQAIIQQETGR